MDYFCNRYTASQLMRHYADTNPRNFFSIFCDNTGGTNATGALKNCECLIYVHKAIIIAIMKKAKDILNTTNLTRLVIALAVLLSLVAIFLVATKRTPAQLRAARLNECKSVVVVSSGDTLSKLLLEQGLSHNDVNAVAQVLKANADITTKVLLIVCYGYYKEMSAPEKPLLP